MASTNTSWNKLGFSNSVGIALNPGPSNLFPNSVLMELHMLIINTKVLDNQNLFCPFKSPKAHNLRPSLSSLQFSKNGKTKNEKAQNNPQNYSLTIYLVLILSLNKSFFLILSSMSHKNSQFKFFDPKLIMNTLNYTFFSKNGT